MFIHIRETHDKQDDNLDQPQLDLNRFPALNGVTLDDSIRTAGEDSSYRVVVKPQGFQLLISLYRILSYFVASYHVLLHYITSFHIVPRC